MSSGVPYIAPWAANFTKYSTQIYPFTVVDANFATLVIPDFRWYRIIYVTSVYTTSAAVGNRFMSFLVLAQDGSQSLNFGPPILQPASQTYIYNYAPGMTTFTNTALAGNGTVMSSIPDLLWGPGSTIEWLMSQTQAGDAYGSARAAVEVYTEAHEGVLAPVAAPLVP